MVLALSIGWYVGWGVGLVVVLLVAALLLAIIALARRIAAQAGRITTALDGSRRHTAPLFDVGHTNHALDRVESGLRTVREGGAG